MKNDEKLLRTGLSHLEIAEEKSLEPDHSTPFPLCSLWLRFLFQISNRVKPQSAQRAQRRLVRHCSGPDFSAFFFRPSVFVTLSLMTGHVFRGSSHPSVIFLSTTFQSISFRRCAFVWTMSFVAIIALQTGVVRGMTGRRFPCIPDDPCRSTRNRKSSSTSSTRS
jgi:hypothetical protein